MAKDFETGESKYISDDALQKYVMNSNDAVEIKLVRDASDIENDSTSFSPEMSHQIYGDSEQIFGYMGLNVKLFYSASRLTTYLSHTFADKVDGQALDGVKPDEVIKPIAEKIPPGYISNLDTFISTLDKDGSFKPFGTLIHKFSAKVHKDDNVEEKKFEIYHHDISPPGFLDYHDRLQLFLLWYIDASSFIDADDDRWRFFLAYEKYMVNGNPHYAVVGYTTVYEYYAYPAHIRPRISQMLVFPPFQKLGVGANMLTSIYGHYKPNDQVIDITVEDPSENFQRLRDFVDCRMCQNLKDINLTEMVVLEKDTLASVQKSLKLNKKQIRRVFEILKFQRVNLSDDAQYRDFRLLVKNRLYSQYRKEDADFKKLKNVFSPEEIAATMIVTGKQQRMEMLDKLYKGIEEEYKLVVDRLNKED